MCWPDAAQRRTSHSLIDIDRRAEAKDDFSLLIGGKLEGRLHGERTDRARHHLSRKLGASHRGGIGGSTVTAKKLVAIPRDGPLLLADIEKGHPAGKLGIIRVTRESAPLASSSVTTCSNDCVRNSANTHSAQQLAERRRVSDELLRIFNKKYFTGASSTTNTVSLGSDAIFVGFKDAVAKAVPRDVSVDTRSRQRRRGPEAAAIFVAHVKSFPGAIGYRIVVPGGQTKFMGVLEPRVAAAAFGDDRAEL